MDPVFRCNRCGSEFSFSADEQRAWYEDLGCRRELRSLKSVRQEYDQTVAQLLEEEDLLSKKRLAGLIDQLYELGGELPPRINENRRRLANQIARVEGGAA